MLTLHLWVGNMPTDFDATPLYIDAAGYTAAPGVTYDRDAQTLAGADPDAVFAEFRRLAGLVAEAGHGADIAPDDLAAPDLTACPVQLIDPGYRSAGESLARLTCRDAATFAAWVEGVPEMRAHAAAGTLIGRTLTRVKIDVARDSMGGMDMGDYLARLESAVRDLPDLDPDAEIDISAADTTRYEGLYSDTLPHRYDAAADRLNQLAGGVFAEMCRGPVVVAEEDEDEAAGLVCGHQIQHDNSGVGHNWRDIDAADIPASVREEIEGEIIDGGKGECPDMVASNGQHYRW